jgi:protein-L-isoaspartate(D-aspartate) O-methyltransferase
VSLEKDRKKLIQHLRREIEDERVLDVMGRVRRELFVPASSRCYAYDDRPLPIGEDQTISQPFIVALMTQSMLLNGSEKVLELGTGSGYQAAILAELAPGNHSGEDAQACPDCETYVRGVGIYKYRSKTCTKNARLAC